jgi:predicted nucleic acid-binding protein
LSFVVDSSITLSWYFEDEATDASDEVLRRVGNEGGLVPSLWRFEVANGLQMAVRRKRIDTAFRDRVLSRLAELDIVVDPESESHVWSASVRLSDRHGLTVYDAAYLELAQRRRLELATLDRQLADAARAALVPVIGI